MASSQLIEIASWRIVSELHRRYPERFKVIETHPGGGQYDCLSLYDGEVHIADFNRCGRFHVFHRYDNEPKLPQPLDIWSEMLNTKDVRSVLDRVSMMLGLPIPDRLPPTTPTTLVYRFIATFLSHAVFGIHRWECRNGFFDTSGYGGGVVKDFKRFEGARRRLEVGLPDDILRQPAYRFWFLRRNDVPELCLETTGLAWQPGIEEPCDLMGLYRKDRRVWSVIGIVAGHLLPYVT
jgi:hypothetical protein